MSFFFICKLFKMLLLCFICPCGKIRIKLGNIIIMFDLSIRNLMIERFNLCRMSVVHLLFFFSKIGIHFVDCFLMLNAFGLESISKLLIFVRQIGNLTSVLFNLRMTFFKVFRKSRNLCKLFGNLSFKLCNMSLLLGDNSFLLFHLCLQTSILLHKNENSVI